MLPTDSLVTLIASLPAGTARLAAVEDVVAEMQQLERLPREAAAGRLVGLGFRPLPAHTRVIDDTLDALADVAGALWPAWYGRPEMPGPRPGHEQAAVLCHAAELAQCRRRVMDVWLRAADQLCAAGQSPRLLKLGGPMEAEQLALAISPTRCEIVMAVCDDSPEATHLMGLARAAEWLAAETGAAVVVLVPPQLLRSPELDSIAYDALELASPTAMERPADVSESEFNPASGRPDAGPPSPPRAPATTPAGSAVAGAGPTLPVQRERRTTGLVVTPLIGLPHPASPGEQLLARRLTADEMLAGLFECNQWVETRYHTRHLVDLVWRDGKLVVEVDGFYWHTRPDAFAHDRLRDFELNVSGYLVLRLPHDDVMQDVERAMRRIQRLVAFHRGGRDGCNDA
ncbi:MAG: endonuclease domain-containing protein [Pirellulales bacterium]